MKTGNSGLRRLVAGVGAFALAIAGIAMTGISASAAPVPGNIDPDATGSIIIHKYAGTPTGQDNDGTALNPAPDRTPLEGVTFRVTEILENGESVPLATAEGWTAIEGLTPDGITGDFARATTYKDVTTGPDGSITAGDLSVGLYLVEEIASGENLIETPAVPFLVTIPYPNDAGWLYDVNVYPKNTLGEISPTKTVGTPEKTADIVIGQIVPFTITVPVAQPALPYVSFSITDALSAGLDFDSWGEIKIGDVVLAEGAANDYTISANDQTVTFTAAGVAKLNTATADAATTVTAVINAEVTDLGQLDNKASATINGTPGETPVVTTNWARLDITKQDAEDDEITLADATFELWNSEKSTLLATGTTDAQGELSFVVWVGNNDDVTENVYLKETVAPQGYVLPADPWTGPITLTAGETAATSISTQVIDNYKPEGPNLPLTGAGGTAVMMTGGLLLIGAGAVAMIAIRRRRNQVA